MIYDRNNAAGALCFDADAKPKARIDRVISVDTRSGHVEVHRAIDGCLVANPRIGEVETEVIKFSRIKAEIGMDLKIKAFHCYGRQP